MTMGGTFFSPLVCESFGVWTPFALSTLSTITHTTVTSGASKETITSVTLWQCQNDSEVLCSVPRRWHRFVGSYNFSFYVNQFVV